MANISDTPILKNYCLLIKNSNVTKHPAFYLATFSRAQVLGLNLHDLDHIPSQTQLPGQEDGLYQEHLPLSAKQGAWSALLLYMP